MSKTHQISEIREIDWSYLLSSMYATVWQILYIKLMQSPETEIDESKSAEILWKQNWEIKWTYFWRVWAIWNHCVAQWAAAVRSCQVYSCLSLASLVKQRMRQFYEMEKTRLTRLIDFLVDHKSQTKLTPKVSHDFFCLCCMYSCNNITTTLIQISRLFYISFFSKTNH